MGSEYFGKYSGIVKDNSDDQNLGQLQVSVPALFPPDDLVAARPALPYGLFFVPEKDQRVWVEFEGGDPGLPIWTGVQSIPDTWPDEAKADPPQKRVIKTASGHVLAFDDKSGEAGIQITDGVNGHIVTLNKDGIQVTDGVNGHTVTLNKDGIDVTLGGAAAHEIKMTSDGIDVKHATAGDLKLDSSGLTLATAAGAKINVAPSGITIDAGAGSVQVSASSVKVSAANIALGPGALPVIRVGDFGVGNLGAPVAMTVTTNAITFA